ncbi:MAG: hypothetical protein KatS3mg108_3815 [Isosphaeraceae bacterium]|jgi:hypothetical protein|nr:MAG: hypothetical protein KatS3mg108_3815 [Isosphaeraceae bacterium]
MDPRDDHPELDGDDLIGEIEIEFDPRPESLSLHGISEAEFETALLDALDAYHRRLELDPESDAPALEEIELTIQGRTHRLGDLADISVTATGQSADDDPDLH